MRGEWLAEKLPVMEAREGSQCGGEDVDYGRRRASSLVGARVGADRSLHVCIVWVNGVIVEIRK